MLHVPRVDPIHNMHMRTRRSVLFQQKRSATAFIWLTVSANLIVVVVVRRYILLSLWTSIIRRVTDKLSKSAE